MNPERTNNHERPWFALWQSKRIASKRNKRKFEVLGMLQKVSQTTRENQFARASQAAREHHTN